MQSNNPVESPQVFSEGVAASGSVGRWSGTQDRRRGDRRHRLLAVLGLVAFFYLALFVWPTPWRYDRVGRTPVRTNRITGDVEYLNLQGWQPALPPLDVAPAAANPSGSLDEARPGK